MNVRTWTRATAAAAATLLALSAAAAAPEREGRARLGLNLDAPTDYARARVYADVMRQSRAVQTLEDADAPVDDDLWPRARDFWILLWDGIDAMHGTYAVTFEGRAERVEVPGAERVGPLRVVGPHRSAFTFRVSKEGPSNVQLRMLGATRPDGSPGATNIKVMRPLAPGAAESHPPTALFNEALGALLSRVQVVRYMDFLATNANGQRTWSDRPRPRWRTAHVRRRGYGWQGVGGPLEHVVLLSNEIRRDAWINVPHAADDEWVRKAARLFAFGSDGVEPYTGPFGSSPDPRTNPRPAPHAPASWRPGTTSWFPPLDPGLRLYVEYSNEVWNSAPPFDAQTGWNEQQANAEVARGRGDLDYDGQKGRAPQRRVARRGLEISRIFREVFGDAQMPSTGSARIRPILASQGGWPEGRLGPMLKYLWGYWNNGDGPFVADPHPPGYHFYGAGGAIYYDSKPWDPSPGLDNAFRTGTMDVGRFRAKLENEALRCAGVGLRRVAYEGGPGFPASDGHVDLVRAMLADPRMEQAVSEHHRAWSEAGGELAVYFTAAGDQQWGFVQDLHLAQASRKLRGLERIAASPVAPPRIGKPVPGTLPGAAHSGTSADWEPPAPQAARSRAFEAGDPAKRWAAYVFRADDAGPRAVTVQISGGLLSRASGTVRVHLDGRPLGSAPAAEGRIRFLAGVVEKGLHGVVVEAPQGAFRVESVALE